MGPKEPVYLDNLATTRMRPEVLDAMLPYLSGEFGNPGSPHYFGARTRTAIETAREHVAALIGADLSRDRLIFTSSATEANNLAILGSLQAPPASQSVIASEADHSSVLGPVSALGHVRGPAQGFFAATDGAARVTPKTLREQIENLRNTRVSLVSIGLANGEVGTINDLRHLADISREAGARVHTDAAQAIGKIPVDVDDLGVDLLTMSAHKFHGPQGAGALYARGRAAPLRPIMWGGQYEGGLRPGTPNVAAIVGFGEAARLAKQCVDDDQSRLAHLRDTFEAMLIERTHPGVVHIHCAGEPRLPNVSSFCIRAVSSSLLTSALAHRVAFSSKSACSSAADTPSHVLTAMGLGPEECSSTVRVGFCRDTTMTEVSDAVESFVEGIARVLNGEESG